MNSDDFHFFADFLRKRSGISLDQGKAYLVEARMASLLVEKSFVSLAALLARLRTGLDPDLEGRVIDEMTTNETSFFRDPPTFEMLKSHIIPSLLEERRTERKLQIWSAACSAGQEAFSIAILLKENFPELADWTTSIVATDLSDVALQKAREGSYSQLEVNRGLPRELLSKYFSQSGVRWQINREIRDMVEFRQLNLVEAVTGLPPADIVFLRNVLLYFELDVKRDALAKVRSVMSPTSYLFLGGAETTINVDNEWTRIESFPKSSCYQLRKA